ncbi:MAG: YbhB/YbcL family Raf kinase inhibitor-like protein [Victivallaceae bacterium]
MRYFKPLFILLTLLCFAVFCCVGQEFAVTSASFSENSLIPAKYVMSGGNPGVSPQISWINAPAGTKSFVVACIDIHPIASNWVHWMVINIPASVNSLPEKASLRQMPEGAAELKNSFQAFGYGGPNPPRGSGGHDYVFTVYALSVTEIKTPQSHLTQTGLLELIQGKVLAQASITGRYSR